MCAVVGVGGGECSSAETTRVCVHEERGVRVVCGEGRWGGTAARRRPAGGGLPCTCRRPGQGPCGVAAAAAALSLVRVCVPGEDVLCVRV